MPPVEKALAFFEQPGESMAASGRRVVVGTPETVRAGLEAVAAEYGAGEVLRGDDHATTTTRAGAPTS